MSEQAAHIDRRSYGTGKRAEILRRRADQLARVLPPDEALEQARWEMNRAVLRALEAGATRVEIARVLGLTPSRIGHYRHYAKLARTPPLLQYPSL